MLLQIVSTHSQANIVMICRPHQTQATRFKLFSTAIASRNILLCFYFGFHLPSVYLTRGSCNTLYYIYNLLNFVPLPSKSVRRVYNSLQLKELSLYSEEFRYSFWVESSEITPPILLFGYNSPQFVSLYSVW